MQSRMLTLLPTLRLVASIFMAWKLLCWVSDTPHSAMVVLSGSMEPAFQRGDIVFLSNRTKLVSVGDIPVVWFAGQPLPMVHRTVEVQYE